MNGCSRFRICCGAVLLCLVLLPALAGAESLSGRVRWIYDGDTIAVSGVGTVRLLGIDAPEREASSRDHFYRRWQITPATLRQIHHSGKDYLIENLKGQTVVLKTEGVPRDRYGRLLAYVYNADGDLINRVILEKGYAAVFRRSDFSLKDSFLQAESQARAKRLGLWQ